MNRFVRGFGKLAITLAGVYTLKPIFQQSQPPTSNQSSESPSPSTIPMLTPPLLPKTEQLQPNPTQQKRQEEQPLQKIETAKKTGRTAKISGDCGDFLHQYLSIFGVQVSLDGQHQLEMTNQFGDHMQIDLKNCDKQALVLKINNFYNPPQVVSSEQQLQLLISSLPLDQHIIATYIPTPQQHKSQKSPKSALDSFTSSSPLNLEQLQKDFRYRKYASYTSKHRYILIRDTSLAQKARINVNRPGNYYIYYKSTPNQGMEVAAMMYGHKVTIKGFDRQTEKGKDLIAKGLYGLLNQINIEADMADFLRGWKMRQEKRKLMVVYSKEKRPEFIRELKAITLKAAKMLREDAVILMTDNPKLLTDYLQIVPDDFVTVRILNLQETQPAPFSIPNLPASGLKYYSRTKMESTYTAQNIYKTAAGKIPWTEYYQQKKLSPIQSLISESEEMTGNTVVLHWKHGCKGCELVLKYLELVQQLVGDQDKQRKLGYEAEIQEFKGIQNVTWKKFNILNEGGQRDKDHDVTPKLILYKNGSKKDLDIGSIIQDITQINPNNEDEVHRNIVRQIVEKVSFECQSDQFL